MIDAIVPVIIARDAEATIRKCLASLRRFGCVIVYDNGSRDATPEICREFPNVRLVAGHFSGFGETKNRAAGCAPRDWIFSLDSDEWPSDELVDEIAAIDPTDTEAAYSIERRNLFYGRHVRRGGWGNDRLLRVYHRGSARFSDAAVHEKVEPASGVAVRRLQAPLWHDAVTDIDQFLKKISYYSGLAAEHNRKGRRARSMLFVLLRSGWAFLRSYVFQLGLLEGWRGIVIAYAESCGTFFRYAKIFARNQPGEVRR